MLKILKNSNSDVEITVAPPLRQLLICNVFGNSLLYNRIDPFIVENIERKKRGELPLEDSRAEDEKLEVKVWYDITSGKESYPASGFHSGMVSAAGSKMLKLGLTQIGIKGAVTFIDPMIPITFEKRVLNTEIGTPRGGAPMFIKRPQLINWTATLRLTFLVNCISPEAVINLIKYAGSCYGIGSFSVRSGGQHGIYDVDPKSIQIDNIDSLINVLKGRK